MAPKLATLIALACVCDVQENPLRSGAEYFTRPAGAGQRRYEAMRAYFVEEASAADVADRFGYSTASVHQLATLLRGGKLAPFVEVKPGPKGPRKATAVVRDKVLALRAGGRSVGEIAAVLAEVGTPISAQTVWQILDDAGLPRLARRDEGRRGSPATLDPIKAAAQPHWPAGATIDCGHAGLLLLLPAMVEVGLHRLVAAAGYPGTRAITAWQSIATLLLAKCARHHRAHHIDALTDDAGLAHALGLTALPKATHAGSYSYRVRRESNTTLLTGLVTALRGLGMASGTEGFNLDFHAIRHHGADTVLEKHYVPRRSQRTRAVLTFFAQDHASTEMVYANSELTKTEQAREIIAFADYWHAATGEDPGLLVFDSQLTTYTVLGELTARGIGWLTLRKRGKTEIARLTALPASSWKTVTIARRGRYRRPQLHEDMIKLNDLDTRVRQIAVRNIGRDEPTLLITNDLTTARQRPVRPLRRTHDHRKRTRRLHQRIPPRRPLLGCPTQRRPRHHPHRRRRQPLPPIRPQPHPLPNRHTRHHLAPLPRRRRHPAHHRQRRHLRTQAPQPTTPNSSTPATPTPKPPSPGGTTGPCNSPSHPDEPPTSQKPQHNYRTGNRGQDFVGFACQQFDCFVCLV